MQGAALLKWEHTYTYGPAVSSPEDSSTLWLTVVKKTKDGKENKSERNSVHHQKLRGRSTCIPPVLTVLSMQERVVYWGELR